jgi:hypothetical protein
MKTETFKGKNKQNLDRKIWDWKLTHGRFVVKKTHPMEDLPNDLHRSQPVGSENSIHLIRDRRRIRT